MPPRPIRGKAKGTLYYALCLARRPPIYPTPVALRLARRALPVYTCTSPVSVPLPLLPATSTCVCSVALASSASACLFLAFAFAFFAAACCAVLAALASAFAIFAAQIIGQARLPECSSTDAEECVAPGVCSCHAPWGGADVAPPPGNVRLPGLSRVARRPRNSTRTSTREATKH